MLPTSIRYIGTSPSTLYARRPHLEKMTADSRMRHAFGLGEQAGSSYVLTTGHGVKPACKKRWRGRLPPSNHALFSAAPHMLFPRSCMSRFISMKPVSSGVVGSLVPYLPKAWVPRWQRTGVGHLFTTSFEVPGVSSPPSHELPTSTYFLKFIRPARLVHHY